MTCGICGRPIEDKDLLQAWKGVTGWVSPKGAKSMVGMKANGELAHPECIVRVRYRMPEQQESLL